jgi:hypothetical protein
VGEQVRTYKNLFESVKKSESTIYNHFKALFKVIHASKNSVISDFKCGTYLNEAIRWNYDDIMIGEKHNIKFIDAIKMKGIIKLDIITLLENMRFVEITEVYNFRFNGTSNMDYSRDQVIKEIIKDYKREIIDNNYMKSLKKMYSILKLKNEDDNILNLLLNYFNSPIGLLYRCLSDINVLIEVLNYSKFNISDIITSIDFLKEIISSYSVKNNLETIYKIRNRDKLKIELNKQAINLKSHINVSVHNLLQFVCCLARPPYHTFR